MTNLAAAVERVKWLVNHNAKMEMIDRSDLETILAELGSGAGETVGTIGDESVQYPEGFIYTLHTKTKLEVGQKLFTRPPAAGLAELTDQQWGNLFYDLSMAADKQDYENWNAVIAKAAREFLGKVE